MKYTVEWRTPTQGVKRIPFYVADINIDAHGVLANDLFSIAGIELQAATTDSAALSKMVKYGDARRIAEIREIISATKKDAPTVLALCNGDEYLRIENQFQTLVTERKLTNQAIEQLLQDVPQEEHPHGFDIEEALQYLMVMNKAVTDSHETAELSQAYDKYVQKLLKYAELGKRDKDMQACHETCLALMKEYEEFIATKGGLPPLVVTDAMKELTHTVTFDESLPRQKVRAIPLEPKLEEVLDVWNQQMVSSGRAHRATAEEIANAMFVLPHIPILKRSATRPYTADDYRFALNAIPANAAIITTRPIAFPTKLEVRSAIGGKNVFSVLDLSQFFDNIPADCQVKILWLVKGSYYTSDVVIQGKENAPHAAHQVTTHIFGDVIAVKLLIIHVDDILIATTTYEEHIAILRDVFERLKKFGLKVNPAKCALAQPIVRFLGMIVHADGVEPDLLRYNSIVLWPDLTTRRKAEKFCGFILYFHQFIKDCSIIIRPIQDAIASDKYAFTKDVKTAFYNAKAALLDTIHLHPVDYSAKMHIHVDTATSNGIGAVLYQEINGKQHPLLFQSRRLNAAEQNYSPTDAELCGVYWACTKAFHDYIQFSEIVIHTDHLNLKEHLSLDKATTKRRRRWCFYLGDYNIVDVIHEKGATFTDCDTLSRLQTIAHAPKSTLTEFVGAIQENTTEVDAVSDITYGLIRQEQAKDTFCQRMTQIMDGTDTSTGPEAHIAQRMTRFNGILHYSDIIKRRGEYSTLIVAPESLRQRIIEAYHNQPAGHRGAHMTALTIRTTWWWPKMIQDIKKFADTCDICTIANTSGNAINHGTLSTTQPITPNEILTIDLYNVADVEAVSQDEPGIALTAIYNFTRYPCIEPIRDKQPKTIAAALAKIFADHGTPKILFHDQGKEFEGEVNTLCEDLGIDSIRTAPRAPHSVGIVERLNEELQRELRRLRHQQSGLPWTQFLPVILQKLRNTPSTATGYSPYELRGIVAAQPRGATPNQKSLDPTELHDHQPSHDKWSKWIQELARKRTAALANDIQTRDDRLLRMNRNRRPAKFHEGDWIRICRPNATKMAAQVSEPHQITQILDNGRKFLVKSGTTGKTIQASITQIQHSQPPKNDTQVAQADQQGKPAALVLHDNGKTRQYKLVEWTSDAVNRGKVKVYNNRRPSAHPTQQLWKLTSTTINTTELQILDTFEFQRKGNRLIVPLQFRRSHQDIPILFKK